MNNRIILTKIERTVKGEGGETIAETLVSVLISALALLLMSTAISSSVNIVKNSREYMDEYYNYENTIVNGVMSNTFETKNIDSEVALVLNSSGKPTGTISINLYPKSPNANGMVFYGGDF